MNIGEVIFWKTLVLATWAAFKEAKERGEFERLLVRFQREWDRRRAQQPLALTDQRPDRLG